MKLSECECDCAPGYEVIACDIYGCTCEETDKSNKQLYETARGCNMDEPCPHASYDGDPGSDRVEGFECLFQALKDGTQGRYFLSHSYFDIGGTENEFVIIVGPEGDVFVQGKATHYQGDRQSRYSELERCTIHGVEACREALVRRSSGQGGGSGGTGLVYDSGIEEHLDLCLGPKDFLTDCESLSLFSCE